MRAHVKRAVVVLLGLAVPGCDVGFAIGPLPDGGPDAAGQVIDARAGDVDGGAQCPSQTTMVAIQAMAFQPKNITIARGTRVTWSNQDTAIHDVTEGNPGNPMPMWKSGSMFPGDSWSYDFCDPVDVVYHCAAHPDHMRGATVTVTK